MCGLTGFIGKKKYDPLKIKILMLYNMSRGKDATGMFYETEAHYYSQKEAMQADEFLAKFTIEPGFVFLGHTRATSSGARNQKNAHPHEYDNCVTIHNGTIVNQSSLCTEFGLKWADYDTDSQILAKVLATDKDENGKKRYKILKDFDGTCATIHYDKSTPDMLMCFREAERPLFRGLAKEGMYFSSLEESLVAIGCTSIKSLKSDCIYHISKDMSIETRSIKRSPIKPKTTTNTSVVYNTEYYNNHHNTYRKDNELAFEKGRLVETAHVISGLSMMDVYEVISQTEYAITIKTDTGAQIVNKASVRPVPSYMQNGDCVRIKRDLSDPKTKEIVVKERSKGVVYEWEYLDGKRRYCVALKDANGRLCLKWIDGVHCEPLSSSSRTSFVIDPLYIDIFNFTSGRRVNKESIIKSESEDVSESQDAFGPETQEGSSAPESKEEGDYEIIDKVEDETPLEDVDPDDYASTLTPTNILIEVGQQAIEIITDLKVALEDAGRFMEDVADDRSISYTTAQDVINASTSVYLAIQDVEEQVEGLTTKILNEISNSN